MSKSHPRLGDTNHEYDKLFIHYCVTWWFWSLETEVASSNSSRMSCAHMITQSVECEWQGINCCWSVLLEPFGRVFLYKHRCSLRTTRIDWSPTELGFVLIWFSSFCGVIGKLCDLVPRTNNWKDVKIVSRLNSSTNCDVKKLKLTKIS